MVYKDSMMRCMEINSQEYFEITVEKLFQKYSYKMIKYDNTINRIYFDDLNVKVQDMNGWTDLIYIEKVSHDIKWVRIDVLDKSIICDFYQLIPCYHIEDKHIGFHGEVLYKYILTTPFRIMKDDNIRLYKGINNSKECEFGNISNIDYATDIKNMEGYNIITKSRFMNADGIYIFTGDRFILNEISI